MTRTAEPAVAVGQCRRWSGPASQYAQRLVALQGGSGWKKGVIPAKRGDLAGITLPSVIFHRPLVSLPGPVAQSKPFICPRASLRNQPLRGVRYQRRICMEPH